LNLSHTALIRAPRARVWKLITDIPAAARCVPGVAAVTPSGAGKYKGSLLVQLGPVRLVLDGDVSLTSTDEAAGKALVRADAKDTRLGGSVRATMDLALVDKGDDTELRITSDVQIAGRIGEFGQSVIQRKADQLMAQFAECLARALA
jgi:carbon monoxide dehydrogenase subunit G